MFEAQAASIEELDIGVDGTELAAAVRLRDRLDAKVTLAAGEFDRAELWDVDGSVNLAAWLRTHAGVTQGEGQRLQRTARRLRDLPLVSQAWADGTLSGGQVAAIVANVTERVAALFAEREATVLDVLRKLDVADSVSYLRQWAARANALLDSQDDTPPPDEPARVLHLSPLLDGRGRLDGDLDPEGHEIVRSALRLAETPDGPEDLPRIPAQRRADALVDVCRHYLDHQQGSRGGRHRPHLNVVIDHHDLRTGGPGRTLDGLPLDGATLRRLACDAAIHRVITDGPGSILDYGRATRTIPPALYTSLVLRDLCCRFPGCDRPPDWCDGHHITHWEDGGPTSLPNLVLLCSRHHHRIHLPGWHLKLLPTGTVEVTAPDGTLRTSNPPTRC